MTIKLEQVKAVYDDLSTTWDNKSHLIYSITDGNSNRTLTLLSSLIHPNMNVADLGCGTGRATRKVLQVTQNVDMYCADISKKMLEIMNKKVRNEFPRYNKLHMKCGDVSKIYFGQIKMDLVIMLYLLHHVENVKNTLKHAADMLDKDGEILIQVPGTGEFESQIHPNYNNHYKDPMGRFSIHELIADAESVGLVPIEQFKDEFNFNFKSNADMREFVKENSILAKISNYNSLDSGASNYFEGLTKGHGEYLTILLKRKVDLQQDANRNKKAYAKWCTNYSNYALKKITNRGYSYDTLADIIFREINYGENKNKVLDIGAGTGLIDLRLKNRNKNLLIYGADLSPDMYNKNLFTNQYEGFYIGDAETIPFRNNYFDSIISTFMIHHSSSVRLLLQKCFNILKNNGKIAFVDFVIKEENYSKFNKDYQSSREYGAVTNDYTVRWMCDQLNSVGFKDIKYKYLGCDKDLPHVIFMAHK